jgi:hypothetical protein
MMKFGAIVCLLVVFLAEANDLPHRPRMFTTR